MKKLNQEEAVSFYEQKAYSDLSDKEKALLQLQQEYLCMPMKVFTNAVSNTLGRSVEPLELSINKEMILIEILEDESPALCKIEKKLKKFHYQWTA